MLKKLSRSVLIAAPALALLPVAAPASATDAVVVAPANFTAKLAIGSLGRSCSAVLVDKSWVMTAADCVDSQTDGTPAQQSTVTFGDGGAAPIPVTEVVVHPDRGVALARLGTQVTNRNVPRLSETGVAAGGFVNQAGFGRTATEWAPKEHNASFTVGQVDATGFEITPKDTGMVCKGDAGGPAFRSYKVGNAVNWEIVGLNTRAWQGGCLGAPASETRKGAYDARVDGLAPWVKSVTTQWKTETLVQGDAKLYQGIRLNDGSWTSFTDVEALAGPIGGVRVAAAAGVNTQTHVLAVGNDGKVRYTERMTGGRWTRFTELPEAVNAPTTISRLSMVSIGAELQVAAVANGKVYHALRKADGTWTGFGDVFGAIGSLPAAPTAVTVASVGGQLQVVAAANGKAYHTVRAATGHWTSWGDISQAAGPAGSVTGVAMAGAGNDAHLVLLSDGGTRQFHTVRFANGTWQPVGNLSGVLGTVTATSAGAAVVNGEFQLALTLSDNRVIHTLRKTDGNWTPVHSVNVTGVAGTRGGVALTGTL